MSVMTPFKEALAVLGLDDAEDDLTAIKRAYRRAVAEHPPDRDPEAFRRVRDAYELLRDPNARARALLLRRLPLIPPPVPPPASPTPRGVAALALLRFAVMRADPDQWLRDAQGSAPGPNPPTEAREAR